MKKIYLAVQSGSFLISPAVAGLSEVYRGVGAEFDLKTIFRLEKGTKKRGESGFQKTLKKNWTFIYEKVQLPGPSLDY